MYTPDTPLLLTKTEKDIEKGDSFLKNPVLFLEGGKILHRVHRQTQSASNQPSLRGDEMITPQHGCYNL